MSAKFRVKVERNVPLSETSEIILPTATAKKSYTKKNSLLRIMENLKPGESFVLPAERVGDATRYSAYKYATRFGYRCAIDDLDGGAIRIHRIDADELIRRAEQKLAQEQTASADSTDAPRKLKSNFERVLSAADAYAEKKKRECLYDAEADLTSDFFARREAFLAGVNYSREVFTRFCDSLEEKQDN